ncbi:hypothetical protein diail_10305 [Diaporthe ilicicola]|nr:hypothetical protein diail_10305 [Diaporthe ilicicola]
MRAGEPKYASPEQISRHWYSGRPLPRAQLAYLQEQLLRIQADFSPEQLANNDMAVLLTVRARQQEHVDMLGMYSANQIIDSGNPGTSRVVDLYRSAIETVQHDVATYDRRLSVNWGQLRQRQYVHFLIPTLHPIIPLDAVVRFCERLLRHQDIVTAFQYEMNGENEQRQPPRNRNQDPAALRLFGKFTTSVPLRPGVEPFWWPVTEFRESTSRENVLAQQWRSTTHLGLDRTEHIQGMLFGHYNREAYPAGVEVDPVAVLVGLKDWESKVDLFALIEGLLKEEGIRDLFNEIW